MSVLVYHIREAILCQKCHINMGLILKGYGVPYI